jgi:glycosyltransferase domain-containing protein
MRHELTLLICLKDRADFTKRLCAYLIDINAPFEIIFADGSIGDENRMIIESFKQKFPYRYIRYPADNTFTDYYEKCASVIKEVITPYVMMIDNDDFPIIDGQQEAIRFLENNADYIGCNGRVAGIILAPFANKPYGKNILFTPYYCKDMDVPVALNQDAAIDRIAGYLNNFYSTFYSIFRTSSLVLTYEKMKDLNSSDLGIAELFFSFSQLSHGKIHSIDALTYVRQKGSSQVAASQKDWFYRLLYTNWLADLKAAIQSVAEHISQVEKKGTDSIYNALYESFLIKQRSRYIPNDFYLLKNWSLFFNKMNLYNLFLHKLYRISPSMGEFMSKRLLKRISSAEALEQIKKAIMVD